MKELKLPAKRRQARHFDDSVDLEQQRPFDIPHQDEQGRSLALFNSLLHHKIKKLAPKDKSAPGPQQDPGAPESPTPKTKTKKVKAPTSNWLKFKEEHPSAPLGTGRKFIAVDCEMVTVQDGSAALARISLVDQSLKVLLDSFVKPQQRVSNYLTWVSGVTAKKLSHAPRYSQLCDRIKSIARGAVLVGHSIEHDLKVVPVLRSCKVIDIKDFSGYRSERALPVGLKKLALQFLGIVIQQSAHSSTEDAIATMRLFLKNKQSILFQQLSKPVSVPASE